MCYKVGSLMDDKIESYAIVELCRHASLSVSLGYQAMKYAYFALILLFLLQCFDFVS